MTWVQDRYSPQSLLRRLQRHAPSWLEQLPQVPDAVLDSLQHNRDTDLELVRQRAELKVQQERAVDRLSQQRRWFVAAVACGLAAGTAYTGGWQWLAAAPPASWLFGGLALVLLWPRRSSD